MPKPFSMLELVKVNQFVQGIIDMDIMVDWFENMESEKKKESVRNLLGLVIQSHPFSTDLLEAIELLKIKKTSNAVVMLTNPRKNYLKYGYETINLSEKELVKVWSILLYVLKISDTRRKLNEKEGECTHWWHKDLSNQDCIRQLLK